MASYLVKTPGNPDFAGKIFGIQFGNGRAIVSDQTIDKKLGWTPEQIAFSMKNDFHYEVMEQAQPASLPFEIPEGFELVPKSAVKQELQAGAPVIEVAESAPEAEPKPVKATRAPRKTATTTAKKSPVRNATARRGSRAEEPAPEPEPAPAPEPAPEPDQPAE